MKTDFDQWSPELALSWRANDQLEFFGRGYRGYNAGGAASSVTLSGRPFYIIYSPERSDNLELGADLDWADGRLTGRLTAFYTSLSNQWTPVLGGADFPLGQIDNSGHSRLFGLEWDARFQIDDSHQLQVSLGYLNTSYVDFVPFERDADLENVGGNDFAGAPEFSGALVVAGEYGGQWRWSAALSHHSRAFANANNTLAGSIPAATLLDLKASYRWQRFEFSIFGRNLLDEDTLETTPRVIRGSGLVEYTPGRPRSIGLAVQYQF